MERPGEQKREISDHLTPDEAAKIVSKINNPRLTADHPEYFIIDMGDFKRYVHKHRFIPNVQNDGSVTYVKVETVLSNHLESIEKNNPTV